MDINQYQKLAERTANTGQSTRDRFINFSFGLAGETGETIDYLKKYLFHGHELNEEIIAKELGDILWYISMIATTAGLKMSDVALMNIKKLADRYPNGFSSEGSVNRIDKV